MRAYRMRAYRMRAYRLVASHVGRRDHFPRRRDAIHPARLHCGDDVFQLWRRRRCRDLCRLRRRAALKRHPVHQHLWCTHLCRRRGRDLPASSARRALCARRFELLGCVLALPRSRSVQLKVRPTRHQPQSNVGASGLRQPQAPVLHPGLPVE